MGTNFGEMQKQLRIKVRSLDSRQLMPLQAQSYPAEERPGLVQSRSFYTPECMQKPNTLDV